MKIHEASSSSYNKVDNANIYRYIVEHSTYINNAVNTCKDRLVSVNRAHLKQIAAELETVQKRLKYLTEGKY